LHGSKMAVACVNHSYESRLTSGAQWYAVQVRGRSELSVHLLLSNKQVVSFLPTYKRRYRGYDRVRVVDAPLFPGYLFCNFHGQNWMSIITTPGVIRILGTGKQLLPIDDEEIEAIKRVVTSPYPVRPHPSFGAGQKIRVAAGPLSGIEGTVLRVKGGSRLVVSVTALQRSIAVELGGEDAIPLPRNDNAKAGVAAGQYDESVAFHV